MSGEQLSQMKSALRAALAASLPDGRYDDERYAEILRLIDALAQRTPLPRPIDAQARVAGRWRALFAQFGPRHTAGKPIVHESKLNLLSFARLPERPLRMLGVEQEIDDRTRIYDNVQLVEPLDGSVRARLVVHGHYRIEPQAPQTYHVEFTRVALLPEHAGAEDELRRAFGLEDAQPLTVALAPPRLSSDVVYCDDDLRINRGSVGGVYVLERLAQRAGAAPIG